jgi:hypothetical protein
MSLEDLGNIGELIAAFGVIISLVYLAYQIRQNTRALHSASYAQSTEQAWLVNVAVAQDAALARLFSEVASGNALTPEEESQYSAAMSNLFFGLENLFRQYEQGLIDSDTWENVVVNGLAKLSPSVWERWRDRQGPLSRRLLLYLRERGIPETAA